MSAPPLRRLPPPGRPDAATLTCDLRGQADIFSGLPDHADLASDLPGLAYELPDLACELRDHAALASDLPVSPGPTSPPCSRSLTRSDLLYRATPTQLHPPPPLPVQDSARPGSTMPDHHAVFSRCWDGRPSVLIDTICRTDSRTNATTASAETSKRFTIRVSFELADPPGVSLCFVHCPGRSNSNFIGDPLILTSAQAFVLLVVSFTDSATHGSFHDYFVYTAGPGKPKLQLIPMPFPRDFDHNTVGILPLGDSASGQYSIVIPTTSYNHGSCSMTFRLQVLPPKKKKSITKEALLARDSETDYLKAASHVATEVISVGGGLLGWVDLWWGILLCNVLDKNPTMRLLQWPVPEPNMDSTLWLNHISPRPSRSVTVVNGLIKFVELKFHEHNANQGWTATIWSRMVSSPDWHKNSTVHSNDVSIFDSVLLSQMQLVLPEILGMEANRLTWNQVICTSPTVSLTSDDDILHLMVKSNLEHPIAFVITVNTKIKALEAVEQCCAKKMTYLVTTYVTSAFSSYIGTTAGPTPANVLEHPYNVDGSNVQDNITVEPPLRVPNEQPKGTHVAASYSLPPAHKDVTKKTFASIVKQGPPTAVVKPKTGLNQ